MQVRWMIRRDMREILEIERECFPDGPWNEEDFLVHLRQRNCIGMIAESGGQIVGYMVYELHKNSLRLLNFAVAKGCWRSGVGSTLMHKLHGKLSQQRRRYIEVDVIETNDDMHLFLKAMGFTCMGVLRQPWEDNDRDAYAFRYDRETSAVRPEQARSK